MRIFLAFGFLFMLVFFMACKNESKDNSLKSEKCKNTSCQLELIPNKQNNTLEKPLYDTCIDNNGIKNYLVSNTIQDDNRNLENLLRIYKQMEKAPQKLTFDANRDTIIHCEEGTTIKCQKNIFVDAQSGVEIQGMLTMHVQEYYKISDMLLTKLSTKAHDNLLETAGMLNVSVWANDKECKLKSGAYIEIQFPLKKEKKEMQLFAGSWKNDFQQDWDLMEENAVINQSTSVTEQSAVFPGGQDAFTNYINSNLIYPRSALTQLIEGRVRIKFSVDTDGSVVDVILTQKLQKDCDQAAIDLMKNCPKFIPAYRNGIPVKAAFLAIICFSLDVGGGCHSTNYSNSNSYPIDNKVLEQNVSNVNSYLMRSSKLHWINCDRFLNDSVNPKINYAIKQDKAEPTCYSLIFHNYKSILTNYTIGNEIIF